MTPSSLVDQRPTAPETGAVVALKRTEQAKSRLGTLPDAVRRRLALTMAVDTLTPLSAAFDLVLVVSDQPSLESRLRRLGLSVLVVAEPAPLSTGAGVGMNGALSYGSQWLTRLGCVTVLACVGDLPALRPDSLARVIGAFAGTGRAFLADASGVGTTMLLARGVALDPRFQGRSAAAHRASGAVYLDDVMLGGSIADARRDVDTEVDLVDASHLGLGPMTAALIDPSTGLPGRYEVITVTDQVADDGSRVVITDRGYRTTLASWALQDGLRSVRQGQRLHAVSSSDHVLAAWL